LVYNYNGVNKINRNDANGQVTAYLYDARNRILNVNYSPNTANPDAAIDNLLYAYDATGKILRVTHPNDLGGRDVFYSYDKLHRLLTEETSGVTLEHTYDKAGNRLTTHNDSTGRLQTFAYDALNRLTSIVDSGT
jgi:YD repeat-containing protein